ncbi:hypothetical protein Leryth_003779 [Lithospermum erythrorhizon]|nr:hypothetical protein Leryth_003779 [Lithospermum erythrorhizon]
MRPSYIVSSAFVGLVMLAAIAECKSGNLKQKYYRKSCPSAERTVRDITWSKVAANPGLAAILLRLQYHDCFVRGCDASILLDTTPDTNATEKLAPPNRSLGGYEVIDDIKIELEKKCHGVVSCADIVALATRDAVSYQFKLPKWEVLTGRRDGRVSFASEASRDMPSPNADFNTLLDQFGSKGLDIIDLVTLSGAHTIGKTRCTQLVTRRLYNFTGKGDADPSLDPEYAETLRATCPNPPNPTILIEMDPGSSHSFDSHYYMTLNQNKGIFRSDAALLTDRRSAYLAGVLENPTVFHARFALSMKKMGAIGVLTNGQGEIRRNCRLVN